ncbi:squalene/phytoene synthase family protein [uncultured Lamprocystis sp.]|jgi:phytoene synthase|uniref:squalene/phytoene synthase family protein n=1 Tax=uncultured Lamprocystis sp. TaxID=543132 RepID=UPI0025DF3FF3|nr:squalene/phytoene synthase family protein [uncultured Lamprocystis sp.]
MPGDWGFPNPATPPGSSTYYSLRLAPISRRDGLAALYGWRYQLQSVLVQVTDAAVAAAKLRWWQDELARTVAGTGSHPLTRQLGPVIDRLGLPAAPFLAMTHGAAAIIERRRPRDPDALTAAAEQDLGALFELLTRAAGDQDPAQIDRARRLGAYTTLVYQIRDCGWLLRRERYEFVSTAQLTARGLQPADLTRPTHRQHLPVILSELAAHARRLRGERRDPEGLPTPIRIRVRLADLLLDELAASAFDLADQRIALTPLRKLWHAWRESRQPPPRSPNAIENPHPWNKNPHP